MKVPRYWKKLDRHPDGSDYKEITGKRWQQFVADVKQFGVINNRKVTLHEDKVLDGWNLYRACLEAGVKPQFQGIPKGMAVEDFVRIVNDNRRHETPEEESYRIEARRVRVAKAKAENESNRTIAAKEGVGEATVRRDLAAASGAPGGAPETAGGTVKGRDGKTYPAQGPLAQAKAKQSKNGAPVYDWRGFENAVGTMRREMSKMGQTYSADPFNYATLDAEIRDWYDRFCAWHKRVAKAAKVH